ncbi:MAG: hypothetical protein ACSLFJ_06345 [Immundisolibacter sp.]|uniref:hypothetical protein n=1 Tax=Immundisolibacter sp. TaxID=1934948 RepID=UPI003EE22B41
MALIACPECAREVSTLASTCPQCGYPIDDDDVQPIELTAKHWKGARIRGWAIALGGALLAGLAPDAWSPWGGLVGVGLCVWGLFEVIGAAVGAWWHHG